MSTTRTLLPGCSLGLLGGGQLGRMFAQAAATMGYHVTVLDPSVPSPAGEVSRDLLTGAYTDPDLLKAMKDQVVAVTTEFENVPAETLHYFETQGLNVAPPSRAVAITQDRNREKAFVQDVAHVPVAPHAKIVSLDDIENVEENLFPGILKTARLGYDGKGQARVNNRDELRDAFLQFGQTDCVLEKRLDLALEISVIVARNQQGQTATFPVSENWHRNGILAVSVLPARISDAVAQEAKTLATRIVDALDYTGVLCVEFFLLKNGTLLVNELAPRPHNSGHATIDACVSSQYEQQVRAMTNMPLSDTTQHTPAVMLNILGDEWFDENGQFREPQWDQVLAVPGAKLHLYAKTQARKGRKMGHVTVLGPTLDVAISRAQRIVALLNLPTLL